MSAPPVGNPVLATARTSTSGHLGALDLARGLAAIAVVLFHFTNNGWLPREHWMASICWYGHLGVRAFFVMSGFVVPFAMWRGGYIGRGFFSFMGRRLVRLYPPYALSVCLTAFFALAPETHVSVGSLAAHAFYLNDFLGMPWLIDVYWTLAIEVQFYIVIALGWRVVSDLRSWPFVVLALVALGGSFISFPQRSLPNFGPYFLLGIAAFRWHSRLGSRHVNAAIAVLSTFALWHRDGAAAVCAAWLPLGLLAIPMTVPRWGRFLGDVSYSLYLFHLATGAAFLSALAALPLSSNLRVALVFIALGISLGAAWLAFRLIEAPAMKWAKRFGYRPSLASSMKTSVPLVTTEA